MKNEVQASPRLMLAAGFIVSQLAAWFIIMFFLPTFWKVEVIDEKVALVFLGFLIITTFSAAIAAYFWTKGGFKIYITRRLALLNVLPFWALIVFHPLWSTELFFYITFLIFAMITSQLGNWFGYRFFFD